MVGVLLWTGSFGFEDLGWLGNGYEAASIMIHVCKSDCGKKL